MITINITVSDCRATLQGTPTIVCGNKEKYSVKFAFDSEWGADTAKTARFVWVAGGKLQHTDVIFTGDTAEVPQLVGTNEVKVGVFEGDLQTTTPARIYCEKSIRCYGGEPAEETPGQYDHIMTLYNQALEQQAAAESAANTARVAAQAATASQSKVEAIVAGNEAYTKDEADSRAAPAIVQSVSGAAVAVHDAADRPLQALVLHGGATQAGTPTPDAPLELVPAVNAGPVNVTIRGEAAGEEQVLTIDAPAMYAGSLDVLTGRALYAGIVALGAGDWGAGRGSSGWSHGYEIVGEDTIALHHIGAEQADDYPTTLCSHFPVASSWGEIVGATTEMACRGNGNGRAYVAVRIKRSRLAEHGFIDDGTGETAPAAFQAWLEAQAAAGTPVQFVGDIDNTAELGVKSAQSYKLTTTVTNDAGAAMSVDYVADTAEYITAYLAKKYPSFEEVAF